MNMPINSTELPDGTNCRGNARLLPERAKEVEKNFVESFRLSPQQRHLCALWQTEDRREAPDRSQPYPSLRFLPYYVYNTVRLSGLLDISRLCHALERLVERHEILRTSFPHLPGLRWPVQVIETNIYLPLEIHDYSLLSPREQEEALLRLREAQCHRPFSQERTGECPVPTQDGRLWQVTLVTCDANSHWLLWDLSALLADVQTGHLLLHELGQLYEETGIEEEELGEPLQYADLAEWQCERLESAETATGRAYWRFLEEASLFAASLPYERSADRLSVGTGLAPVRGTSPLPGSLAMSLSPVEKAQLEVVAQKLDVAVSTVLLACWGVVLSRLVGTVPRACPSQTDLFIGTRVNGRNYQEVADAIGPLAKSLPLRYRFLADTRISSLVQQIEATVREADEWQEYFSWQFVASLGQAQGAQDQEQEPFCPLGFAYEILPSRWQTGALQWIVEEQEACLDHFKLSLSCLESSHSMQVRLHFDQERFAQEDMQRLLTHWQTVLQQVLTNCDMTLGALQFLTHEEQDRQLREWNVAQVEYTTGKCFHHVFEEQVELTPEAIAVVFEDGACGFTPHLTYGELNTRANQLAHWLCRSGVGPEVLVGVFMEPSLEMVVGLLGILKAGGTYVPLDPSSPDERLAFVVEETRPVIVLTQAHLILDRHKAQSLWPSATGNTFCLVQYPTTDRRNEENLKPLPAPVDMGDSSRTIPNRSSAFALDTQWDGLSEQPCTNPVNVVEPENLAYVIYTSGSTGKPKGVMITHQGLSNYLNFCRQRYPVEEGCGSIVHSSLGFDLTITSLFAPLMSGRAVHLVPEDEGIEGLVSVIRRYPHLSLLKITPAHLELLNQLLQVSELQDVTHALIIGGEALAASTVALWRKFAPQTRLINEYGPTETVVGCSVYEMRANDRSLPGEAAAMVPIGSPISQTQLYILDEYGHLVPVGVKGELFIGGAGVARGYKYRADLTAERFVPHPFSTRPGDRLYRSGDLARYQPDGTIEFLGRMDDQVKLRGYRIELGEIEAILRAYPAVQEAVVVLREEPEVVGKPHGARKYLLAYLVARVSDSRPTTVGAGLAPALQGYLGKQLPEYMLPSIFIFLDALPLNPHGKVDKRALPVPDRLESDRAAVLLRARTPTEEVLAAIWASVLGREQVGIHEDFFRLGGDSMLSIQVLSQARERGIHFSLQQLFQQKTIAKLVQVLGEQAQKELLAEPVQALSLLSSQDRLRLPADVEDAYPLTMLQRGMVFYSQYEPASGVYHDITSFHLEAPFNLQLMQTTLERLVVGHPILRTSFDLSTFSEPLQLVHRSVDIPLQVQDLRTFSPSEQEQKLSTWLEKEKSHDFVWRHPPLLRFQIHLRTESTFQLTLSFHHAILDGWSTASLLTELTKTYLSLLSDDDGSLVPPPRLLYRDFVALEQKFITSQDAKQYWLGKLQGAMSTRLPRWTSSRQEAANASVYAWPVSISGETGDSLRRTALSIGVPLRSVLLAAHLKVLSVLHGHQDILTGFVSNGRLEMADGERVLGVFLNTLPFRLKLSGGTWIELIQETFAAECELLPYRWYPLVEIQKQQGGQALFETLFYFNHFHVYQDVLKVGNETSPVPFQVLGGDAFEKTNFTLAANFSQDPISSEVHLTLLCNARELCPEQVMAIGGYYMRVLEALAVEPDGDYQWQMLLSAQEQEQVLAQGTGPTVGWNATKTGEAVGTVPCACPPLQDWCVHQLIVQQVERTPDAVALVFEDVGTGLAPVRGFTPHVTYAELNRQANQLASHLQGLGVGPEVLVGICMERSIEMVVGLLAVLKAGGAYVPLDPNYPQDRLVYMLKDAQVSVVLTQESLLHRLSLPQVELICVESGSSTSHLEYQDNPICLVQPENLAYLIYTSGSTGYPKGVMGTHRASLNRFQWMWQIYPFSQGEVCCQKTNLSFVDAVWEIFGPLLQGVPLVIIADEGVKDPSRFRSLLEIHAVTRIVLVPSLLRVLLEDGNDLRTQLRQLTYWVSSGEPLALDLAQRFVRSLPAKTLINLYGSSEVTADVTCYEVGSCDQESSIPIGRPIANTQVYLLDSAFQLVPIGVPGEVYIGGENVTRGYWQRADLTAERFLPHPFVGTGSAQGTVPTAPVREGQRMYRTGDLARYRTDGTLEYLGRIDSQVKLRGFRIELGEIEATLQAHPAVQEAVVVLYEEDEARKALAAYVVPQEEQPRQEELQSHLREHLPDYMVPATFIYLETLPLTPNGKVDRVAIRLAPMVPAPVRTAQRFEGYVAPQSELEQRLAEIWQEVLGVQEQVSTTANFFDLGGHSLLIIQVQSKLQTYLGYEVPLVDLFQYPTIATLSTYLSGRQEQQPRPQPRASRVRERKAALRTEELPTPDEGLAIVGLTGRFPGARNLDQFWQNLCNGVESTSFFSEEELLASGVAPDLVHNPRYVKARAILDDVESFDAAFFGYSPKEAATMDPQQRLFLECAWEVLEQAGYNPDTHEGLIGVYAGQSASSYLLSNMLANPTFLAENGAFSTLISNDKDYLATRTCYKLNLKGPGMSIQTACSTSLVAVHMACQGLLRYECDMALAGGVSIGVPQKGGYLYEEEGIFSPDGHCRAFDADARGTVTGSGVGIVALKRLSDALADGDTIYAVIRGSAINNDGASKVGYTAPSVEGQVNVITEAMATAGVEPDTISYVETHGTGTPLGDPIEIAALTQAFRASGGGQAQGTVPTCAIGSLKTNVGHLDTAAGVAGLIKTVLALQHGMLPPSLHFHHPNPKIDFAHSPFYVNTHLKPWNRGSTPRRAGVSSFGIGGTNAHVILEEAPSPKHVGTGVSLASHALHQNEKPLSAPAYHALPIHTDRPHLVVLSAKTASALETMTERLATYVKAHPDTHLADMAYTLQIGRKSFPHRRAFVVQERADILDLLSPRTSQTTSAFPQYTNVVTPETKQVAFLFPGQGTQYVNMGRELYEQEPSFREQIDTCARLLVPHLHYDLREILYPSTGEGQSSLDMRKDGGAQDGGAQDPSLLSLHQTGMTQPALFVVEYALAQLLMEWGIHPQVMIGHSIGEYVAACLAGVFSLEEALALVALRGRLMQALPVGAMLSVALPEKDVEEFLGERLALAACNGPNESVVSGTVEAIELLEKQLTEKGIASRRLHTSHAFHSQMMSPILERFTAEVSKIALHPPKIPYISNITGTWITDQEVTNPAYWAQHLCQTVRWASGVQPLLDSPNMVLLEVGPGHSLSTLVRRMVDKHKEQSIPQVILSSLRHPQTQISDRAFLLNTCGQLWCAGVPIDWSQLYADEQRRRIPLPTYPFEQQRYWISPERSSHQEKASLQLGKEPDLAKWFSVPSWKRSPLLPVPTLPEQSKQKDCWLIFTDPLGLGTRLGEHLQGREEAVITVKAGTEFRSQRTAASGQRHVGTGLAPVRVPTCPPGPDSQASPDDGWEYTLRPESREDYDMLLKDMNSHELFPTRIIHLWTVIKTDHIPSGLDYFETAQALGFYSLLFLTQALGEQHVGVGSYPDPLEVAIISNNLQEVIGGEMLCPVRATALGVGKVVPSEYPHITFRSIDVVLPVGTGESSVPTPTTLEQLVNQISAELRTSSPDVAVAYRGPQRWVQCIEPVRLEAVPQEMFPLISVPSSGSRKDIDSRPLLTGEVYPPNPNESSGNALRQQGVYLITGGLGGIGMALATDLASRMRARLVLIGRTTLPARAEWDHRLAMTNEQDALASKIRQVKRLEELGAEVLVIRADVTDMEQMQNAVREVREHFGDIHGVIHAAGIPSGGLIQLKTPEMAAEILAPKVKGTLVLEAVLKDLQLDFLVLCSSVAALIGGLGQVDYCAANTFLDSFASDHTAQQRVQTVSINWDIWQEVGMAVNTLKHYKKALKYNPEVEEGLQNGILPQEGTDVFRRILYYRDLSQVIVSTSNILTRLQQIKPFQFRELQERDGGLAPPLTTSSADRRPNLQTPYVAPQNETQQQIAALWQKLLGIEKIGIHDNFLDLGGHSLLGTQLITRLRDTFQVDISLLTFFEEPTVAHLAIVIVQKMAELVDDELLLQDIEDIERLTDNETQTFLAVDTEQTEMV